MTLKKKLLGLVVACVVVAIIALNVSKKPSMRAPLNPLQSTSASNTVSVNDSIFSNQNSGKKIGVKKDAVVNAMTKLGFEQISSTDSSMFKMQSSDKNSQIILIGDANNLSQVNFESTYSSYKGIDNTQIAILLNKSASFVKVITNTIDSNATQATQKIINDSITQVNTAQGTQTYETTDKIYKVSVMKTPVVSLLFSIQ